MSRLLLSKFASLYRIDIAEAEKKLDEYESLNEFFTRRLRPGARPVDADPAAVISPVDGTVIEWDRIPGTVFPVNDRGMRLMPQVLSSNARLVTYIRHEAGVVGLVKVGAMNVSSIRYSLQDEPPEAVRKGDDLAFFEFGSTVVLLMEKDMFVPDASFRAGAPIRMGQRIGMLPKQE